MPNAYVEIYTELQDDICLKWVDDFVRKLFKFYDNVWGLKQSDIYLENYQELGYTFVHFTTLFSHETENAYQLVHEFISTKCDEFLQNRPNDCHILLTPQSDMDYNLGLGYRGLITEIRQFPMVNSSSIVGYQRLEVIVAHKKTGFSVIANGHRSKIGNTELAREYLFSRIKFYKKLPKDAIWH